MASRKKKPSYSVRFDDRPDGTCIADINCTECGQPITHTTPWGMFCDKECGLEASKEASKFLELFGFSEEMMHKFGGFDLPDSPNGQDEETPNK